MNQQKNKIWAFVGMLLFMLALFIFLWLVTIDFPRPNEDDLGIELTMMDPAGLEEWEQVQEQPLKGDPEVDGGDADPTQAEVEVHPAEVDEPADPEPTVTPIAQVTESPVVVTPKVNEDSLRQVELEAAEKARKKAEREKAAAERRAKEEAARAKAASMTKGIGGSGTGSTSAGGGGKGGSDYKGLPKGAGSGTSKGAKWSLAGRNLNGDIPIPNKNNIHQAGTVVVEIQVDNLGNVVSATATATAGTNVSDATTIEEILRSAKKTKFSEGDQAKQKGTITYTILD